MIWLQKNHCCRRRRRRKVRGLRESTVIIELKGHIGKDGKISLETQKLLPLGDMDIVIAYTDRDNAEAQDEAEWDAQFAVTPTSVFDKLIEEGLSNYRSGQTDQFDPNVEDD